MKDEPLEKTGYRIPRSLVAMVREAVDAGEARSQNELLQRALRRELRANPERRLNEEYARAAQDAAFMVGLTGEDGTWSAASGDGLAEADR